MLQSGLSVLPAAPACSLPICTPQRLLSATPGHSSRQGVLQSGLSVLPAAPACSLPICNSRELAVRERVLSFLTEARARSLPICRRK